MAAAYTLTPDPAAGTTRPSSAAFTKFGGRRAVTGILTISGSYTSPGGDAIPGSVSQFTPNKVEQVIFMDSSTSAGRVARFDRATGKLSLFHTGVGFSGPLAEVGNGAALGSDTIRVLIAGY